MEPCPICRGKGQTPKRKRRLIKKWKAIEERTRKPAQKLNLVGKREQLLKLAWFRRYETARRLLQLHNPTCWRCDGLGSAEARDDDVYRELLEEEASERGLFITESECDPCDVLVGECRDVEGGEASS